MTREEVKAFIKNNFGVEEPTDDMITNFLNIHNKDVQKEKDNTEKYKEKAKLADDLQKQLDDISESKMGEVEKAQKALDASNSKVADLEKKIAIMERKTQLAEKGIVGEDADKLFKEDGSLDIEVFGKILADRETQAKTQAEKDLLGGTPDPKGGEGKGGDESDPIVDAVVEGMKAQSKESADIVNNYFN